MKSAFVCNEAQRKFVFRPIEGKYVVKTMSRPMTILYVIIML